MQSIAVSVDNVIKRTVNLDEFTGTFVGVFQSKLINLISQATFLLHIIKNGRNNHKNLGRIGEVCNTHVNVAMKVGRSTSLTPSNKTYRIRVIFLNIPYQHQRREEHTSNLFSRMICN